MTGTETTLPKPRRLWVWTIRRRLIAGYVLLCVLAAVVSYALVTQLRAEARSEALIRHTLIVIEELWRTLSAAQDTELGFRGFLIDGAEFYRERHRLGGDELPRRLQNLQRLTVDNPVQQAQAQRLEEAAERLLAVQNDVLSAPPSPTERAGMRELEISAATLRQIRSIVAGMIDHETRLLQSRDLADAEAKARTETTIFIALFGFLALLFAVGSSLLSHMGMRKRAEQQAAIESRLLKSTLDTMTQGVQVFDEEDRLLRWNDRAAEIVGLPKSLMRVGVKLEELLLHLARAGEFGPGNPEGKVARRLALLRPRQPFTTEYRRPSGLALEVQWLPLGEGKGMYVFTDVTERDRVQRMQEEFVSTVSHELRTPLTSIGGSLSLLATQQEQLPDRFRKLLGIARSNCERLIRLVNDLLDVQKLGSGAVSLQRQRLDLCQLVDDTVETLRSFADNSQVRLNVHRVGTCAVEGDPDRLAQVVTNLVSNAVKFSPAGAAVDVRIEQIAGRDIRVGIADRGPGIDPAFEQRIFGRFAQSDSSDTRRAGGTGLGLSIAKALVELHGGRIGFERREGGGTVFWFEIPAAEQAA